MFISSLFLDNENAAFGIKRTKCKWIIFINFVYYFLNQFKIISS